MQAFDSQSADSSESQKHLSELRFSTLSLSPGLQQGIAEAGFTYCTPIQERSLPRALEGHDVAGQAQTGTGKTAAYLIALFERLGKSAASQHGNSPRALVLAPTRELAVQIHADATVLAKHLPLKLGLAFGGTDYEQQRNALADGVDVLIATPGRLIDYFKQQVFNFRQIEVLVIDEADRMFDLGFIKDLRYILRRLPSAERRLNLLYSATLSHRVLELAYEHMNDPELLRIEPDKKTVDRVRQVIYFPSNEEKFPLLVTLLRQMQAQRTMIFVNTRRGAERLQQQLQHNDIKAEAISGDVPQRKRLSMLKRFLSGELPILIGTDVASRGLHVPDVSHVFNYDLPQDAEDYVHRIGRTARAGAEGDAISFGCENYVMSLPEIEDYIGHKIPVGAVDPSTFAPVLAGGIRPRAHGTGPRSNQGHKGPRTRKPHAGRSRRDGPSRSD